MKGVLEENRQWIDETWDKLDKKLKVVSQRSKDKIPYTAMDGVHDDQMKTRPSWWTNGFWPGLMWVMYCGTKDDTYKEVAQNGEKLLDAAFKDFNGLHHDVGFMWHISSGMDYRLFGGEASRTRTLYAANMLAARYNIGGGFLRAWNEDKYGWTIIDTMMNIPLLYWASKETGDPRYRFMAEAHADMAMRDHVRPDGSVNHIVVHDHYTGEVLETLGGQGYEVGSSWSRGVSWALYGFVLSYIHTGKKEYLDTAKRVANYFISCVCDDYLPRCDFRSPDEPVLYDSTAGAIAACGLIEIAKNVGEYESNIYMNAAVKMLRAMGEQFGDFNPETDPVLLMGTEAYHAPEKGKHIPIIYGDFYFAEALYKLRGGDILFW